MERGNDDPETSAETRDSDTRRPGIGDRLRETVRAAGEGVTGTADTITGVQFRRQFEDFTDAVTTAVVGVHRDQAELRNQLDELENARKSDNTPQQIAALREQQDRLETSGRSGGTSPLVIVFGVVATLALALGIIAVLRTF